MKLSYLKQYMFDIYGCLVHFADQLFLNVAGRLVRLVRLKLVKVLRRKKILAAFSNSALPSHAADIQIC